ncbi:MAG: type B 50S ribosomal protein L31 [Halothiobacillaceae bacterium]
MKPDIHPNYRPVVFHDLASGFSFLTRSTIAAKETIKWEDGNEYPLVKVEISSKSHPFFTGQQQVVSTARQVDKFRKRYGM